ncbi:hypothetical protein ACOMHN_013273 [Nucella lapillus]
MLNIPLILILTLGSAVIICQAEDIELNPGPPKRDSSRQSKLQGADQTSDAASSHSQHAPDSKKQSIAEVLTMLHSMNTSLNQKMDDLKSEMSLLREELHGEVEQLRSEMLNIPLILILTLGSAVIICQAEDGGTIKCDASASEIGETGEVQCMYPTDLTGIAAVRILHFEPNSTNDVPIVDCRGDEIRHCNNVEPGFKITEVTGKSLKVTISKVTKGHFGKYVCEIKHASLDFSAEPCIFQIKGATSPGLQSNSPVVDEDPESGEVIDSDEDLQTLMSGGTVAGIVTFVVIIVVLTAGVVLCYFRLRRRTHATNSSTIEDPNEDRAEDPMIRVNYAGGQNRHGNPTETNEEQSGLLDSITSSGYSSQSCPMDSAMSDADSGDRLQLLPTMHMRFQSNSDCEESLLLLVNTDSNM